LKSSDYISLIAGMSEKIPTLRVSSDAQQYFAEQFKALFHVDVCAFYRVSEKPGIFIRSSECKLAKKGNKSKFENRITLPNELSNNKDQFLLINHKQNVADVNYPSSIYLTIRRAGEVELLLFGHATFTSESNLGQNDICRIFSNFYLQVEDALEIRNKINEKQQELSGRISENNETLFQMNEKLITYNQELQQFAYSASHDLQEPLRTISSYISLFLKNYGENLTDEGREYLNFASNGAQRMHHLIKDLLTYSKLNYQNEPTTTFKGNDIIRQALDNLHIAVEESNALILYPDLPVIHGNQSQVILLFQNLIDNAIKFRSKNEPLVIIDIEDKLDKWEFKISDNGIGIAHQFQHKIFGIFNRLHGRDEIQGSGLGLSICKKIVEKHNGSITVESKPGKGTTFIFSLTK